MPRGNLAFSRHSRAGGHFISGLGGISMNLLSLAMSKKGNRIIDLSPIKKFMDEFVKKYPNVKSIWLFGSRANGCVSQVSDWDLLVFGNIDLLNELRRDLQIGDQCRKTEIDLFIVYDGNHFEKPWQDRKGDKYRTKSGSLLDWGWNYKNKQEAEYEGSSYLKKEKKYGIDCKSFRIWPASKLNIN